MRSLSLEQFRNYTRQDVELGPGLHVFEGRNAQGKTALLEAIYLGATARSFRTSKERDLIQWDQVQARIDLQLQRDSGKQRQLSMRWTQENASCKREIWLQENPIRKLSEFLSELPLALFTPDDLELVQGGPQERRGYVDLLLCKLYPVYLETLGRYQKALRQKSALLKTQKNPDRGELESWDQLMTRFGTFLTQERATLCQRLEPLLRKTYQELSGEKQDLAMTYQSSGRQDATDYWEALQQRQGEELRTRSCLIGPHRDEIHFHLGPGLVRRFGSQGQRRTLALALRLAQADILRDLGHENPVVLLDDCFSELDPLRQGRLLEWLESCSQVMITTATPLQLNRPYSHYQVEEGRVQPC